MIPAPEISLPLNTNLNLHIRKFSNVFTPPVAFYIMFLYLTTLYQVSVYFNDAFSETQIIAYSVE
jgi:hypothetical protein